MMWASIIKRYYLYGMSYTRLSKSVVSEYEHGEGTTKRSHVRKVQEYLSNAERHIYEAILELSWDYNHTNQLEHFLTDML